ncbi:hypothetical protein [Aquimarina sp. I32.4]|uniref:hypothetical protein n=1 Tax=Aquimarina sp. I32.4 TaxID=2053903 RepID=UPI000CDED714|nr:hypothetical protein [Aquimarina sp. I32.4]
MTKRDFGLNILETEKQETFSSFQYNPIGVQRTYGVLLRSQNEKEEKVQIHYEIDIMCLEQKDKHNYIFEIYKHPVYANEKKPDSIIDELAASCGAIIYPLQIMVNSAGAAIEIINYKTLQERWKNTRSKIKQSYNGAIVNQLISNMDHMVDQPDRIKEELLHKDWFMVLFFAQIYRNIDVTHTIALSLIPYKKSISYQVTQNRKRHPHKEKDILIEQKGKCIDIRNEQDILRGNLISLSKTPVVNGTSDFTYQIYAGSPIADAIVGHAQIDFPSGKKEIMDVEIYHLKNKTPQTSFEKEQAQKENENKVPIPEKKKKRYFFFGKELKL